MTIERPDLHQVARGLLVVGVAAPVVALVAVIIAATTYGGFDHARQYLSELGGETAPYPLIFNAGVMIAGVMTGLAGLGFGLAVVLLTRSPISAVVIGLLFVLAGIGLVMSSLYAWPDPRHLAINLGLGIQLAPVALLIALRKQGQLLGLRRFLLAAFLLMALLTVMTKHLIFPGTVNDFNVGYWERAFAIVLVGWVGVAAYLLQRHLSAPETATTSAHIPH